MRATRTQLMYSVLLSILLGLTACSSKKSVFSLEQEDERWFCTPETSDEWRCQESDDEFNELGAQRAVAQETPLSQDGGVAENHSMENMNDSEAKRSENKMESAQRQGNESIKNIENVADNANDSNNGFKNGNQSRDESIEDSVVDSAITSGGKDGSDEQALELVERHISPWVIQLAAYHRQSSAEALSEQVEGSQLFNTRVKGRDYICVVVMGFEARWKAQESAKAIKQQYPQLSPWVRQGADFERYITH